MEIKIWSDVRCPFCYIGKRKFEAALERFPMKDEVKITWKSFQLDPSLETVTGMNNLDYFVRTKGVSVEQARQMFNRATKMAREAGLDFNIEQSIPANSFMAHRLIHLAQSRDLGSEIEEALFKAHFTDAKNIDEVTVLVEVADSIGMDAEEVKNTLESDAFAYEVKQDELEAHNIGVKGVPFFVLNDKYAVSGAQPTEFFLETLEKAWKEFNETKLEIFKGDSCSPGETCN